MSKNDNQDAGSSRCKYRPDASALRDRYEYPRLAGDYEIIVLIQADRLQNDVPFLDDLFNNPDLCRDRIIDLYRG